MASISSGDKRHPSTSVPTGSVARIDFLRRQKASIDLSTERVRLRGSDVTFPLHTKSSSFPAGRRVAVRAARNLEMPARTEREVMARLDTPDIEGGTWIVEDSSETENTVMVACAIVQPKSRMIPVRLVNCTSETLTIYADKQIALAEVATDTVIGSVDDPKDDSISRRGVLTREKEEILWGLVESADAGLSLEQNIKERSTDEGKGGDTMGTSGERGCRTKPGAERGAIPTPGIVCRRNCTVPNRYGSDRLA